MSLASFHPLVRAWFRETFGEPTRPQAEGWPRIAAGEDTLIAAPTGSGKTLAAFLSCLDRLLAEALRGPLPDATRVVYVSPLKALSNDVSKNLKGPLEALTARAAQAGLTPPGITVAVRTGDTSAGERAKLAKRPPHILVTTPESLYILLTTARGRAALATVETVIVDEIHAVADDKRGSHLALTLERLEVLVTAAGRPRPQRIGLSATQRPIERVGALLAGARRPLPAIVDAGFARALELALELPPDEIGAVATHEMMEAFYDRVAALTEVHRTTLLFVNTRRLVERVAHHLAARLGEEKVAAHHGSLSKERRLDAEQRLKSGALKLVVATASLELGIDVGEVDLVVQLGSPRSIATFLQRVGRSGHHLRAVPKGLLYAMTRDDLVECAALLRAVRRGALDLLSLVEAPLDILAQQVVAITATEPWDEGALYELVTRAAPYGALSRQSFDQVLEMLAEGITTQRGRTRAYLHRDRVNGEVRGRRSARLAAVMAGGAIPDRADYPVIAEPDEVYVGSVDEDWAVESSAGDIFLLGNTSWRVRRIEAGRVRVEDARGAPPSVPFWRGEAPARTRELSDEVSALRAEVEAALEAGIDNAVLTARLEAETPLPRAAAEQLVAYLAAARCALGALPTHDCLIAERFFDDGGGMQLILHAPLGGRLNRAWGLALRKRFCKSFNFELQAAATDDGVLISLGPMHSFPLETVFDFLSPETAREVLTQAVLQVPLFGVRWRWNAQRALAVPRSTGAKRVPPQIIRMRSEDLLAGVFPMAAACQDNIAGDIELPDHPLVNETLRDCLTEAMDIEGLEVLLGRLKRGELRIVARDTPEPSPLAHQLLNAAPYAYLDDAPLEERRARAVTLRRTLAPELASTLGALDPEAIATASAEAWPEARDPHELHDALLSLIALPAAEGARRGLTALFESLVSAHRATSAQGPAGPLWVAVERLHVVRAAFGALPVTPEPPPLPFTVPDLEPEAARVMLLRGHLEAGGPRTAPGLARALGLGVDEVRLALFALEAEGALLRGSFGGPDAEDGEPEWCDRRILARIHRLTLGRLRREIAPVSPAELMRFLFRWQHVQPGSQLSGVDGALEVVAQLSGFEASALAWERDLLPARLTRYAPELLDAICLSGEVTFGRLAPREGGDGAQITRAAPLTLALRESLPWLLAETPEPRDPVPATAKTAGPGPRDDDRAQPPARGSLTPVARAVVAHLEAHGASFLRELVGASGFGLAEVEDALKELVFTGLVTADGFAALRGLLERPGAPPLPVAALPGATSAASPASRWRSNTPRGGGGRWYLLRRGVTPVRDLEAFAGQLLHRYGVLFRDLLAREVNAPPWRDLLGVLRQLEARGVLRGGRFVAGFTGEQYALPEAVEGLRAMRRAGEGEVVRIAAADPLNLVGVTSPGPRVPAVGDNAVLYRDGVPLASREAGRVVLRGRLAAGESIGPELTLTSTAEAGLAG